MTTMLRSIGTHSFHRRLNLRVLAHWLPQTNPPPLQQIIRDDNNLKPTYGKPDLDIAESGNSRSSHMPSMVPQLNSHHTLFHHMITITALEFERSQRPKENIHPELQPSNNDSTWTLVSCGLQTSIILDRTAPVIASFSPSMVIIHTYSLWMNIPDISGCSYASRRNHHWT